MNAGQTSERVLSSIRQQVLAGALRPGTRLDAASFAEALYTSITPVRDALHMLVGQGLVEARTSDGFYIPHVSEPTLRDLYAWNGQLLQLIVRGSKSVDAASVPTDAKDDLVVRTRRLFDRIARTSPNLQHRLAIAAASDRLEAARRAELAVLTGVEDLLHRMEVVHEQGSRTELGRLVGLYHRQRTGAVPGIVRILYQ